MAKISDDRLRELEDIEARLSALDAGGVDNWDFYEESLKGYYKQKEDEDRIDGLLESICEAICLNVEEPAGSGAGYGITDAGLGEIHKIVRDFIKEGAEASNDI